ncbi:sporulation protein [Neptunitalea chrysea]|uniref:Sporulation protein n=1 Tax=Neptunitalea chrysea TaxID=1647581 RepID=A0A9W6EU73_9FLAO|nr:SPOR domain-containing protein [Neptunitalea chrysea]GLB50992.1 sporulation protein [Neptunitalea chrysea]
MRILRMKTFYYILFGTALSTQLCTAQDSIPESKKIIEQSPVIEKLITLKKSIGPNESFDKIYTVQIFSGNKPNALETLKEVRENHPEWIVDMYYEYPNYKIKIGKYRKRLEADKELTAIKEFYPNAFVINPKQ